MSPSVSMQIESPPPSPGALHTANVEMDSYEHPLPSVDRDFDGDNGPHHDHDAPEPERDSSSRSSTPIPVPRDEPEMPRQHTRHQQEDVDEKLLKRVHHRKLNGKSRILYDIL